MSDNGNQDAAQAAPAKTVIAQFSIDQAGQLVLQVSNIVTDPESFGLTAIQLIAQMLKEEHAKQAKGQIARAQLVMPPLKAKRQ